MKNDVCLVHQFGKQMAVFERLKEIMHAVILLQMADVFHATGTEIVHDQDFVAALQQTLRQMRPDESCSASN